MVEAKNSISPQAFLEELRRIRLDVKSEALTPEGRAELLKQMKEMETLVLELKKRTFSNGPAEPKQIKCPIQKQKNRRSVTGER